MGTGAHGDLFPVRFLKQNTPVNYVETNEPLHDLEANQHIIDGRLREHIANHPGGGAAGGGGGGGTPVSATATLSLFIDKFSDIAGGGNRPPSGTVGTDIDALVFEDGQDQNQKFEYTVPDDYDSGDIELFVQFTMSAGGGGDVDFDISGEIVKVGTGSTPFGPTASPLAVGTSTLPQELVLHTIVEGSFSPGDRVRVDFERQGTTDANSDDFNLIGIDARYTGFVAGNRSHTVRIDFTSNTDEPPPAAGIYGTDVNTLDYSTTDAETKFTGITPEEWDEVSDPYLKITYAMSTSVASSVVRIGTEGEVAKLGNSVVAIPTQQMDIAVPGDTSVARTVSIPFEAALFSKGSVFAVKVARRNSGVTGNHTGNFQVLSYEVIFGKPGTEGENRGFVEEYLTAFTFGNDSPAAAITAAVDYPSFAGDFEVLYSMASTSASGRVDVDFQGRIPDGFSKIDEINIKIKGSGASPEYLLRIYTEGNGATPSYDPTAGTPITANPAITTSVVTSAVISPHPVGSRVFHVVVEAHIDASETVFVSRPFVRYS
jgi:hypothetical protein